MQKKEEPRRFESAALALPPLKMVLVHAGEEKAKRPAKKTAVPYKSQKDLENLKAVIKLIGLLSEEK